MLMQLSMVHKVGVQDTRIKKLLPDTKDLIAILLTISRKYVSGKGCECRGARQQRKRWIVAGRMKMREDENVTL